MKLEIRKNSGRITLFVDGEVTEYMGDQAGIRAFDCLRDKINEFMRTFGEGSLVIKVDGVLTVESDK